MGPAFRPRSPFWPAVLVVSTATWLAACAGVKQQPGGAGTGASGGTGDQDEEICAAGVAAAGLTAG